MVNKIPSFLLNNEPNAQENLKVKKSNFTFLDKTIRSSAKAVKSIYIQAENSSKSKVNISPITKLFSLLYLVIIISLTNKLSSQLIFTAFILFLYILSGIKIWQVYRKIIIIAFFFGFLVVLPASLNIIVNGNIIFNIITLSKPYHIWIYHIPQTIGFTSEGINIVMIMFFRVLNSVSLTLLVVYTTPLMGLIKSLKILRVPDSFIMIITMTYKFIFILCKTIEETYLAFMSRLMNHIKNKHIRELIAGRIFFIFKRSMNNFEHTYQAMVSRGYDGKVTVINNNRMRFIDIILLIIIFAFGVLIILN